MDCSYWQLGMDHLILESNQGFLHFESSLRWKGVITGERIPSVSHRDPFSGLPCDDSLKCVQSFQHIDTHWTPIAASFTCPTNCNCSTVLVLIKSILPWICFNRVISLKAFSQLKYWIPSTRSVNLSWQISSSRSGSNDVGCWSGKSADNNSRSKLRWVITVSGILTLWVS